MNKLPGDPFDSTGLANPQPVPIASIFSQLPITTAPPESAVTEIGPQLRMYRLAATTNGEFYQANGSNDFQVIFSLLLRVSAANVFFERDVGVRLILADATRTMVFDDPANDPIVDGVAPCTLREANRFLAQVFLDPADYDLGFLFSTGSSGGCVYYNKKARFSEWFESL